MNAFKDADPAGGERAQSASSMLDDAVFSDHKGRYKKSIEKRQSKLLDKLPPLKGYLDEGETIQFVTTGCSPTSVFEQLLTGWIFVYLKRCMLVFTDKRILHVPTKTNYAYRNSIAEIRYSDCREMKLRGAALTVKYQDGRRERFLFIARPERRKIKSLLADTGFQTRPSEDPRRAFICPRCSRRLPQEAVRCEGCRLAFKTRAEGRKLGLLFPGGGYFYTRHPFLGFADAVVELVLILVVVAAFIGYIGGEKGALEELIAFSIVLAIEKSISVYHSNHFVKEYITEEKQHVYYSSTAAG